MCISVAPLVFRLNHQRQAEVHDSEGDSLDRVLIAAEQCPVGAISVIDSGIRDSLST